MTVNLFLQTYEIMRIALLRNAILYKGRKINLELFRNLFDSSDIVPKIKVYSMGYSKQQHFNQGVKR